MPSVLIVDDNRTFRSLARRILEGEGFEVVGDAADGESALGAVESLHPDVVLLDVQLPRLSGIDVAERLLSHAQHPAVVLVSTREATEYGPRLRDCGACGFLPKRDLTGQSLRELLAARRGR